MKKKQKDPKINVTVVYQLWEYGLHEVGDYGETVAKRLKGEFVGCGSDFEGRDVGFLIPKSKVSTFRKAMQKKYKKVKIINYGEEQDY